LAALRRKYAQFIQEGKLKAFPEDLKYKKKKERLFGEINCEHHVFVDSIKKSI